MLYFILCVKAPNSMVELQIFLGFQVVRRFGLAGKQVKKSIYKDVKKVNESRHISNYMEKARYIYYCIVEIIIMISYL